MAGMVEPVIRPVRANDAAAWHTLWRGYCDFYRATVPEAATAATWARVLEPDAKVRCIVAELDGRVCGLANYVLHENTWGVQPVCYLEDLFVQPSARGKGVGKALVEALRRSMATEGWSRLYWNTREDNAPARRLYDRFTRADGCVRYVLTPNPS